VLEKAGELLKGDTSLSAQHDEVADALRATGQPVLMILDDLDRLAPAELMLVFKLVRFVGRLPYIYYLLSYDETTLLDVLIRTDLCSQDRRRARDYLEKIIQVRLDLPPLRHTQASRLFRQGIESVAAGHAVTLGDTDNERLAHAYERHISDRLTTPRAINRYIIQLDALYPAVAREVDFVDFAVLSFIRTFEPALYGLLSRMKGALATSHGRRSATRRSGTRINGVPSSVPPPNCWQRIPASRRDGSAPSPPIGAAAHCWSA
jgi:predicted KAP-like P-loop ATPase